MHPFLIRRGLCDGDHAFPSAQDFLGFRLSSKCPYECHTLSLSGGCCLDEKSYGHHVYGESCKPRSSEEKTKLENQVVHSRETLEDDVGSRNDGPKCSLRGIRRTGVRSRTWAWVSPISWTNSFHCHWFSAGEHFPPRGHVWLSQLGWGGGCFWGLVGRDKGCCWSPTMHEAAPYDRVTWP